MCVCAVMAARTLLMAPLRNDAPCPLIPLQDALATATSDTVRTALDVITPDAVIHMCAPIGDIAGAEVFERMYAPLFGRDA